jgi:hypothetical protein
MKPPAKAKPAGQPASPDQAEERPAEDLRSPLQKLMDKFR